LVVQPESDRPGNLGGTEGVCLPLDFSRATLLEQPVAHESPRVSLTCTACVGRQVSVSDGHCPQCGNQVEVASVALNRCLLSWHTLVTEQAWGLCVLTDSTLELQLGSPPWPRATTQQGRTSLGFDGGSPLWAGLRLEIVYMFSF
jgi:hypothetical protein